MASGSGEPFVEYALPPMVADVRDQADIRWILNYGRRYGATMVTSVHPHGLDPGAPFDFEIKADPALPHVFEIIMSVGRQFTIMLLPLMHNIEGRARDQLYGGGKSVLLQQHNATLREEIHVLFMSRAGTPRFLPDDGTGERDLKRKRKDE